MKKVVLGILLLIASACFAQTVGYNSFVSNQFFGPSAVAAALPSLNETGTNTGDHYLVWVVSGSVSSCTVQLETSTVNSGFGLMASTVAQTCTSTGELRVSAQVANFVRANVTAFTATGSVSFTYVGTPNTPVAAPFPIGNTVPWSSLTSSTAGASNVVGMNTSTTILQWGNPLGTALGISEGTATGAGNVLLNLSDGTSNTGTGPLLQIANGTGSASQSLNVIAPANAQALAAVKVIDTTGNTNSGGLVQIATIGSSTATPITVTAQGTANGIQMSSAGLLAKIGSGSIKADAIALGALATAATTASASVNIPAGTAPTGSLAGDIWNDSTKKVLTTASVAGSAESVSRSLGAYQGTASVGITTTNFTALVAAASDIKIPANLMNVAGRKVKVHASGIYTNAAASLLNARIDLCTISGCQTGTDFAAAGCAVVTTNQANNLTNGQWSIDCTFTSTSTIGATGTLMAKALVCANLGATTAAVQSCFQDTATAVSATVDETVNEFVNVSFKFSSSNAGNSAIAHELDVSVVN